MLGVLHIDPAFPDRVFLLRQVIDQGEVASLRFAELDWVVFEALTDQVFYCGDDVERFGWAKGVHWHYVSNHPTLLEAAATLNIALPLTAERQPTIVE